MGCGLIGEARAEATIQKKKAGSCVYDDLASLAANGTYLAQLLRAEEEATKLRSSSSSSSSSSRLKEHPRGEPVKSRSAAEDGFGMDSLLLGGDDSLALEALS